MPGFAGFDRSDYPGDAVMSWLRANTNLAWCGYYLAPAPSHDSTSWMTRRPALHAAGWGIAPLYVGQQITGPGSHNVSPATGAADGANAASLMAAEGFPPGSYLYLDLENGPPLESPLLEYVAGWCDAVLRSRYKPGIYCSHAFASDAHNLRSGCRIWAYRVQTNRPHPVPTPFPDTNPSGCGYIGAYIWQLGQNCIARVPVGNSSSLMIDLNTALTPDPGAPDPPDR